MNVRSISFRLVAWYAGWLAVIFFVLSAVLYLDLRRFLETDLRRAQLRRAHQAANVFLAQIPKTGEPDAISRIRDWYAPEVNDRFIRITRGNGDRLYVSGAPHDGIFDPAEVATLSPSAQPEFSCKIKLRDGKTLLLAAINFKSSNNSAYLVEFGELLDPTETMLRHLFLQLAFGLPLAVLIIAGGGYLLLRRALTPVEQITNAAERITQHNLSERLPVAHTGDELARLSVSFNRMIARLDEAFQNSQRFVADASHDLRTPLTILRGELEGFVQDLRLPIELRERAAVMLEETLHLAKIVEQLFTLSRLAAGEARTEWTKFDLAALAKTTADQMSLLAEDKEISISCDTAQKLLVEGDAVRLKQVIVNLLDNAIKYTPEKGAIQMRVHGVNGHVVLEVKDNGIGISSESLPQVFERFYRVDKTRSGENESAGLGLSIVKAICAAHGAQIEAQSTIGQGSCFRVTLPVSRN